MSRLVLERRKLNLVNTDPQRRCYNGCHAKSELQWGPWYWLDLNVDPDKQEEVLNWWRGLNEDSVRNGGRKTEFRITEKTEEWAKKALDSHH